MHARAYLFLFLTTLMWGGNAVAGKMAVGHVSPMMLTAMRWFFAFALLCIVGWPQVKRDWPRIRARWTYFLILGGIGFALFNVALYNALLYTSAINVSIEQAAIPMMIFIINFALFKIRATWGQVAGFSLSVLGVAFVASHGDPAQLLALDLNRGDAMMLFAVLVYAVYTVYLRFKPDIHWLSLMTALTGAATIASIPFAIYEAANGTMIWPDATGWGIVVYTTLFASIASQTLYIMGIALIGSNRAGLFVNLLPVLGTILSIVVLRERFEPFHAVALSLVIIGITLAEFSGRRAAAALKS
ncbi:DMT family transporter [Limoniibacter endophyticus]|uniref:Membrane protein n=1 Tax=Limoniibacter endophyticus TaxID=1565040 RepID=A0A8J3DU26_9HYPH|nr:DMT family transporter [Limoniibacter endophyticus]GHC76677.1 membrane protein [Limoniibacter endophyticus]